MTKTKKKTQRKRKKNKVKQVKKDLKEKIGMFSQIGEQCLICDKPFDKQNKEMVQSWYVIVREQQDQVNLYCPGCWNRANSFVKQLKEEINAPQS